MVFDFQKIISLLPILIISITIIFVMISIILVRNNITVAIITTVGLQLSLFSLFFVWKNGTQTIVDLLLIDYFSIFYLFLILLSALVSVVLAYEWLLEYPGNKEEAYLLILIISIGGILLVCAQHWSVLFIGLELMSIPLFGLIGYDLYRRTSLEASIKYTLLSIFSSSFLLFGIALIYMYVGTLSFVDINQIIHYQNYNIQVPKILFLIGLGMIIFSFSFKLSLFPCHLWTPDVYQGSSVPAVVILSNVNKVATFVAMIRLFIPWLLSYEKNFFLLFTFISCASILYGNLLAIKQDNIKRIFGYSSIVHAGYILIIILTKPDHYLTFETMGVYFVSYLLANFGIFSVISLQSNYGMHIRIHNNIDMLCTYRGLFWSNPVLAVLFTIPILSLLGIPMTLGFISKFYLVMLSINNHLWYFIVTMVISSAISVVYYLRIIINLYLLPPINTFNKKVFIGWSHTMSGIIIICTSFLIILFGIYPKFLIYMIHVMTCV